MIPFLSKIQNDMSSARERRNERLRRLRLKARRRSFLEKLEDRHLMAALVVTNGNDSGDGSLRAMIEIANNNKEPDTITFAEAARAVSLKGALALGDSHTTTIQGPVKITYVGGGLDDYGAIDVRTGGSVELSNVEITGLSPGRAVTNAGVLKIRDSTLHGNRDEGQSGAAIFTKGNLEVINSTISNNFAKTGGGVYVEQGVASFVNTTVTNNRATEKGGGISIAFGDVKIFNSIIAGNFNIQGNEPSDLVGKVTLDSSNNLVGDISSAGGLENGKRGNIVGVSDISTVIDTKLQPNDGHAPTHALVANSLAIDKGNNSLFTSSVLKDQRGLPRIQGQKIDIGAVEDVGPTIEVTNEGDSGDGSLRAAIEIANKNGGSHTIKFAPGVSTISVTGAQLQLTETGLGKKTMIQGPVTIKLSNQSLMVATGVFAEFSNLDITGATQGAITNSGSLVIQSSTLRANKNSNGGGAITGTAGLVTVVNSTISGNEGNHGGAIHLDRGAKAVVVNSTLTNNKSTSGGYGGGIDSIDSDGPAVTIHNSIIAGNFNNNAPHNLKGNVTADSSNNLVGEINGGLKKDKNNILDVSDLSKVIGPLSVNGTHPLVFGGSEPNPAIDAGDFARFSTQLKDQLGNSRIDGDGIDIGAVEYQDDSDSVDNFIDVGGLRFATTGKFVTKTGVHTSKGVVDIGLVPTSSSAFAPLLRLRGGIEIDSAKLVLSTTGRIAALTQGKMLELMNGVVEAKGGVNGDQIQKILIPLAILNSAKNSLGFLIGKDQAIESRVSENQSFKPASMVLTNDGLKMSGFLSFDALNGAGINLPGGGQNHFLTDASVTKAIMITKTKLPLRTATNRTPSKQDPILLTLGQNAFAFADAVLNYSFERSEFRLEGTGHLTFEDGSANLNFKDLVIVDGKLSWATRSATVKEFSIANVTFTSDRSSENIVTFPTDEDGSSFNRLDFKGSYYANTQVNVAVDDDQDDQNNLTEAEKDARKKERAALEEALGPKINGQPVTPTWSLVNGKVQRFVSYTNFFKIGGIILNSPNNNVMELSYDPASRQYRLRGREQILTQSWGVDGNGVSLGSMVLNVNLNSLSQDGFSTGIVITNGRFDSFKILVDQLVGPQKDVFRADDKKNFAAHYDPLKKQLKIVGQATVQDATDTDGRFSYPISFGTIDTTKAALDFSSYPIIFGTLNTTIANLNFVDVSRNAIVYSLAPFDRAGFKLTGSDLEAVYDVTNGRVAYSGSGIWNGKGSTASVVPINNDVIPKFRLDGTLQVDGALPFYGNGARTPLNDVLNVVVVGMELQHTKSNDRENWSLTQVNGTSMQIQVDGNYVPVSINGEKALIATNGISIPLPLYVKEEVLFLGGVQILGAGEISRGSASVRNTWNPGEERYDTEIVRTDSEFTYKSNNWSTVRLGNTELETKDIILKLEMGAGNLTLKNDEKFSFRAGGKIEGIEFLDGVEAVYQKPNSSNPDNKKTGFTLSGPAKQPKVDPNGKTIPGQTTIVGINGSIQGGAVTGFEALLLPNAIKVAGIAFSTDTLAEVTGFAETDFNNLGLKQGKFVAGSTRKFTGITTFDVGGTKIQLDLGSKDNTTGGIVFESGAGNGGLRSLGGTVSVVDNAGNPVPFKFGGVEITPVGLSLSYDFVGQTLAISGGARFKFAATAKSQPQTGGTTGGTTGTPAQEPEMVEIVVNLSLEISDGRITKLSAELGTDKVLKLFGLELKFKKGGFSYDSKKEEFAAWGTAELTTGQGEEQPAGQTGTPKKKESFFKGVEISLGSPPSVDKVSPDKAKDKFITDVTKANPAVVTVKGHGYSTGDTVIIKNILGMSQLKGSYVIGGVTEDTFTLKDADTLKPVDSRLFAKYERGGQISLDNVFEHQGAAFKTNAAKPGILIKKGKLESINIGVTADFELFGVAAKPNIRVEYTRSSGELVLTGGLEVMIDVGVDKITAKGAFPGKGLLINTKTGQVELRGLELSAEIASGPLKAKAAFKYERNDLGETTISGEGEVTLPGGLTVGAGFEFSNGGLNAINIKVSKENPGIQIGNTGVFLTSIEGAIRGFKDPCNLKVEVKVTGSLGPTISIFGVTASLVRVSGKLAFEDKKEVKDGKKTCDAGAKSVETTLTLTGTVTVLEGWVGQASGSVKIYFTGDKFVEVNADMRLYPGGILRGDLLFVVDSNFNVTFDANLAVFVPDNVPIIGGHSLGSFRVYMQIRPNDNRRDDFARVKAELDLKILKGSVDITANFAGELFGVAEGSIGWCSLYCYENSKRFNLQIPGTGERDLVFLVPDTQSELNGFHSNYDAPPPELIIGEVILDPDGPGGTVRFTGSSQLPNTTTIELFVDKDADGHDGHLLASGLAFREGQQSYYWSDLAAFSSVPYAPNEKLYVYGRIHDGATFPVQSNYSQAIIAPNFSPSISLPGEHSFGTNQRLVFSSSQQNAISISDPLAVHDPSAKLVVTLGVGRGKLFLDPQQATPWTNVSNPTDVDGIEGTGVSDALQLISMLNEPAIQATGGRLPSQRSTSSGTPMYDVNGDGKITGADAAALSDALLNPDNAAILELLALGAIVQGDGSGRLQLIGTAAEINELLDGLTYQSYENAYFSDRLDATVNRFPEFSQSVQEDSIPLTARALTVGAPDGVDFLPISYEQGSQAARLLGDVRIASAMSGHIQSAMIQIDGYDPDTDVLSLPRHEQISLGIYASFDSTTGTMHLTGSGLIHEYRRAIELTTFSSQGTGERTLRVHLSDAASNVAETGVTVQIIAMNQAPVVKTGLGSTYVSGRSTVISLLPSITVQDTDSATLRKAVITLDADSYRQGEDVLTCETTHNITGRFNALTGQLVLTGEAGQRAWSAALSSVKYRNTLAIATPGIRQIDIMVDDGGAMNSIGHAHQRLLVLAANTTLQSVVIGNLPTVSATVVNDDGTITLAPEMTLTAGSLAIDSLVRVDVKITGNFIAGSDFLSVGDLLVGMDSSYDAMNGVLTITGDVPVDLYEFVLQGVNYSSRSLVHDGVARTITFTVFDGFTKSQSQSMTARFEALPVVQAGMELLVYETGKTTQPLDPNISVMYAGNMLTGATVGFINDYLGDQDRLLFTNQNGITGSFDLETGLLTLSGSATVAQYQAALRTVQYTNTRVNPLSGLKQLGVYVQDGDTFSDSIYLLLEVDTKRVASTVTATTTAIAFTEGNTPIVVAADITIGGHDEAHESGRGAVFVTSATVFIDGYVLGEDVLTSDVFESEPDADGDTFIIDSVFDVENGVLFLDGRATPEQYQRVLRSIRYENVSAAPSTNSRELLISVAQGISFAEAPPITVTVTSLNDAPTRIVAPPTSATLLENANYGSLGLVAINYAPPSPQQPYLVLTVSSVPAASLGSIELTRASGVVVAAVGGVYTLAEIRSAVFVPALNASGTGTFVFTVAGFNPILSQPDPAQLIESIRIDVAGVDTTNPGAAFVAQVFRDLLGRNATQQELDALDAQFVFAELSDTGLREDVVAAVRGSREYGQRVVTEAYNRLLGRAPTQAEMEPWLGTEKIVEDFANGLLPATLQLSEPDAAGAIEFRNGAAIFSDQFSTPFSLQTVDSNLLKQNFTAEVTVSIPSSELGFFGTADSPQSVDVVGNTAYAGYGTGVFRVLDVSNPANITELGSFNSPGSLETLQVVGNKAYVGGSRGLRVLDVSNPANITELGFFVVLSSPRALQVVGNTAYVADQFGLRVLDVSDPANISELGSLATPSGYASDVQVIGDIAYVVITRTSLPDSVSGLRVLNVSDPANISELGFFGTDQAMRLQVIDSTAYIADLLSGLRVLDVSNPASISQLGYFGTGDFTLDVKVLDRTAYVTGLAGFQVLDVSNPANISKFASFDLAGRPNDWQFIGSTAYVAVGGDGLRVLDVPSVEKRDKGAAYFGLETGDGLANKRLRVAPNQDSSVDVSFFIDSASSGGAGTHRLQVRWNAVNQTAVFAIDEDYAGGDFVADYTFYEVSANIELEHLYFGSGAGTSFDDFAISFESPPNRLDEVNNHILSSPEYFTTVGGGSFESFVQAAFDDLVNREPTARELDAAVSLLRSGTSRADIARQIEFSDEATGVVADQLFEDLLRRTGNRFETVDIARRIHDLGSQVVINGMVGSTEYYVRYGTQTSGDSRSTEEIEAANAELIRHWLEGTPTVGNSQVTNDFEAVGTISTDGRAHGGGTLIASQYVLTAAHLVEGKDISSLTFSVGLTSYGLEQVYVHPDYLRKFLGTQDGNDIAILKLNRPVVDVAPVSLWVGDLYAGDSLTLVGFGPHPGDAGFGTKRSGTTPIDGLTHNLVTWSYDGADETTTVPGDSGSPQFLKQGDTYYVTSLTSGGTHQALSLGDFAYNTRVSSYFDWIDSVTDSQVTRSVSEGQGLSFTASSVTRPIFPSSFVTFNNHASVELSGNDLLIQDISTTGDDNAFYISTTATHVVISDAHQKLTTSITGTTGSNTHTITVPLSSFSGNIVVRSAGGNDAIDVTAPSRRVNIDAGDGTNRLIVNGSDAAGAEEFFVRNSSTVAGSLEVAMPTTTTGGAYIVQATRIHSLELNTGAGNDTVRPQDLSGLTTPLVNFLINLGDGDDVLHGTNGTIRMIVDGEDGNDSLIGGAANDQLTGGFGEDSLAGGPGDDTYVFDADDFLGADTIAENPGEGSDTLDFSPTDFNSIGIDLRETVSPQAVTTINNLLIKLSENIENVTGGSHGNAIIGNAGLNILRGGNGVDYIIGGGGADQIFGVGSADILHGSSESQIDSGPGADLTEFSGAGISFPNNLSPFFVLSGIVPGTNYDQVRVSGVGRTVTLGGNLEVSLDNFVPQVGDRFTIVDLQGASSVINGTFNHDGKSLDEGDIFTADGHRFRISYVAGDGNDISLTHVERLPGADTVKIPKFGEVDVIIEGNDVVVRQKTTELLRKPGSQLQLQGLHLTGTAGDDTYNIANLAAVYTGLVGGNAGAGYDTLRMTGSGQALDLTSISNELREFEMIDIIGGGNNSLKLNVNAVLAISQETRTLRVRHDASGIIEFGNGWITEKPEIVDNQFVHVLRQDNAKIEIVTTTPYHNPLRALDTDDDGSISLFDVLVVINRINLEGLGELATPTSIADLTPFYYYDANRDGLVSPLDVLIVINFINNRTGNAEGEAILEPFLLPLVSQNIPRFDALSRQNGRMTSAEGEFVANASVAMAGLTQFVDASTENQDDLASFDAALEDWCSDFDLASFNPRNVEDDDEEDSLNYEEEFDSYFRAFGDKFNGN